MAAHKILIAEDNPDWSDLLDILLQGEKFEVFKAGTGRLALILAQRHMPDLAIVDIRLPDTNGQELCKNLRAIPGLERLPVVALSSFTAEKIKSLELGVDAFVSKLSGQTELVPTIEALLRRVQMDTGVLVKGDLRLDPRGNSVHLGARVVSTLTRKEFLFLYTLVRRSPAPVSRDELRQTVMHAEGGAAESRALEMLVTRVRRRLGHPLSDRIKGSRSFGWLYVPQAGRAAVPQQGTIAR